MPDIIPPLATGSDRLLVARSIELAERAKRLEKKTGESNVGAELEHAANILIQTDNPDRFYQAQTVLEQEAIWADDRRSLAHELNGIDQVLRYAQPLPYDEVLELFMILTKKYVASTDDEVADLGFALNKIMGMIVSGQDEVTRGQGTSELLAMSERLLASSHDVMDPATIQPTILQLRAMRDTILVERETAFDINILKSDASLTSSQDLRLLASRKALDEIYKHITPIEKV